MVGECSNIRWLQEIKPLVDNLVSCHDKSRIPLFHDPALYILMVQMVSCDFVIAHNGQVFTKGQRPLLQIYDVLYFKLYRLSLQEADFFFKWDSWVCIFSQILYVSVHRHILMAFSIIADYCKHALSICEEMDCLLYIYICPPEAFFWSFYVYLLSDRPEIPPPQWLCVKCKPVWTNRWALLSEMKSLVKLI